MDKTWLTRNVITARLSRARAQLKTDLIGCMLGITVVGMAVSNRNVFTDPNDIRLVHAVPTNFLPARLMQPASVLPLPFSKTTISAAAFQISHNLRTPLVFICYGQKS